MFVVAAKAKNAHATNSALFTVTFALSCIHERTKIFCTYIKQSYAFSQGIVENLTENEPLRIQLTQSYNYFRSSCVTFQHF